MFSWAKRATQQEGLLTMLQDMVRNLRSLSGPAAHAAAMTSLEGGATHDLSVQEPSVNSVSSGTYGPGYGPTLQGLAAVDDHVKAIDALPLKLATYASDRQKQQTEWLCDCA